MAPTCPRAPALAALCLALSASAEPGRLMRQDKAALSVDAAGAVLSAGTAAVQDADLDAGFESTRGDWTYDQTCEWYKHYPDCGGKSQSPLNIAPDAGEISKGKDVLLHSLRYTPRQNCSIKNNGHAVQVDGPFGDFLLPDGRYEVKQFHFHVPSEHSVGGQHAAAEMHIVHQKVGARGTDDLAVVGVLMQKKPECKDDTPCPYWRELNFLKGLGFGRELPKANKKKPVAEAIDLNAFSQLYSGDFYHYLGSLTTPPCTEGVHWYVAKQYAPITDAMLEDFTKNVLTPGKWNNRPVQASNQRPVVFDKIPLPQEYSAKQGALSESSTDAGFDITLAR